MVALAMAVSVASRAEQLAEEYVTGELIAL
jgi:hypothetical protein